MRIFQINELGDIEYDRTNRTMCNVIPDSKDDSDFATSRTIVLTYFKHMDVLKDDFIKNKRNIITDEETVEFFESHLDQAFSKYPYLRQCVKYEYINNGTSFEVMFYFQNKSMSKHIVFHTITI